MPIRQAAASSEIRGMGKAVIGTAASVPVVASPGLPSWTVGGSGRRSWRCAAMCRAPLLCEIGHRHCTTQRLDCPRVGKSVIGNRPRRLVLVASPRPADFGLASAGRGRSRRDFLSASRLEIPADTW